MARCRAALRLATVGLLLAVLSTPHVYASRRHHRRQTYQDIDADGADSVQITIYPTEAQIHEGREASFECRARTADNSVYPPTRWTRVGGPLPSSAHESGGRLSFAAVSLSDAGRYVCVASHRGRTVEATANLNVLSYGPQELQGAGLHTGSCTPDEKACSNNECVKAEYVCDGEPDCADRSDELNCPTLRQCEPNEFKCNNQRCVQKMWLCDGDNDCGDNSDEQSCSKPTPGDVCKSTEFKCHDGQQCLPSSYHCDGTNDCRDGSDEIGCVQPTVVQAPETNKQVPVGSTFSLSCKAVAVPEPYINWRLNWGPVCEPPRCVQTSEGGHGTLTVNNAQPIDQGAYTCEAINVKGRVLATPDCIVRIVDIPAPYVPPPTQPPPTYPPARCDIRGSISGYADSYGRCECKSEVTGPNCDQCRPGAYHLSEKSPQGCLKCFCFGITEQCRSSEWHRTKERLEFNNDSEGVLISDVEERNIEQSPQYEFKKSGYLTYPEQGGASHTKYWRLPQRFLGDKVTAYGGKMEFELEFSGSGPLSTEPMVVLKGNQNILVHRIRNQDQVLRSDSPIRITVETYETNYEQLNGSPANREDLMMVLADLDAFLIRATHVSNQQATSLGDVSWEIAVDRRTPDGLALEVEQCSCPPGYIGTSCEDCAPGYERSGQGPYLGTCVPIRQPQPQQVCGSGAQPAPQGQRCQCKTYATGPNCDQCAPNSFYMAPQNPQGCIPCFCSGVTQQCQSSSYQRKAVEIDYRRGDRDQLSVTSSDHRQPFTPPSPAFVSGQSIDFSSFHEAGGQTLYWKLPEKFLGNKVTAYGGTLKFTFKYSGDGRNNQDAHVIIRGNDIALQYTHRGELHPDRENTIELKIFEDKFQRVDGQQATREHLLMALADLDTLLIKATYIDDCAQSSLISASLEYAEPYGGGPSALEVEQCVCPPGYVGTSCEDCAPGYSRTGGGLYLGLCEKCECNGHANQCHKEYGHCLDCQHNTEGDQCERCMPGFVGDARRGTPQDCQPAQTRAPCQCNNHSPRGCDSFGRCLLCEHNTEGVHCERCKKGFYGDATKGTPYDCQPCPCPGASECYLDANGQVACRNCPAGFSGRLCNECAPGYTRSAKPSGRVCEPIGRVEPDTNTYIGGRERVQQGGHPPQPVVDPQYTIVDEGDAVSVRCWVPGIPDCQITWHKEHIGGSLPHGAYQTGNALKIPRAEMRHAGRYICTAVNQYGIGQSPPAVVEVRKKAQEIKADPPDLQVNHGDPARFRCWVPGDPDAVITWSRSGGQPLPPGVMQNRGILHIPSTTPTEIGEYVCTGTTRSNPNPMTTTVNLRLNEGGPPQIDPPTQTVDEGQPSEIRCWVPNNPRAQLQWSRADGRPLPNGATDRNGVLRIDQTRKDDAGQYICTDTTTRQRSPPGTIHVRTPLSPQIDPRDQTVPENTPSRIRCWVPGHPNIQLQWRRADGRELNPNAQQNDGHISIAETQRSDEGQYICSAIDPSTGQPVDSEPGTIRVTQPIRPIVDPPEQTVPEGDMFRITCRVPGHPQIPLSWRRADGSPLNAELGDGRGPAIQVSRAQLSDAGDYICIAHPPREHPVDSEPATVIVNPRATPPPEQKKGEPPAPVATPPLHEVKPGTEVRFHCDPHSSTPARIKWGYGRADGPLPEGVREEGEELIVESASDEVNEEFFCVATNDFGTGTSNPVRVETTTENIPPTAKVEPRLWTGEGGTHKFICITTGSPPPEITWTGPNGAPLPHDVTPMEPNILDFASNRTELNGDYTCTATNIVGKASDHGSVFIGDQLKVWIETPNNANAKYIDVVVGDKVNITCKATGSADDGEPQVEWLHDPGPERGDLPEDFVPITISEQFITHPSVGLLNAGVFTCRGTNKQGSVEKQAYLRVHSPESIATVAILGGSNQWFDQGETGELVCAATGNNIIDKIEWVKIDDQLPPDVEEHNEPGVLHLNNFKNSYAGNYQCRAYRKDELIASANVTVNAAGDSTDEAKVTIDPPKIRVISKGESTVLRCNVENPPENVQYSWRQLRDGHPIRHGTKQTLEIRNANPEQDFGIYRCDVENEDSVTIGSAYVAVSIGRGDDTNNAANAQFEEKAYAFFNCPIYSVPGAKVEWTRDGGELPANALPNGNRIEIKDFDENSVGLYTCRVTTQNRVIEGHVQAQLFVPQTIIQILLESSGQNTAEGENAWIDCKVTGDPDAKITWSMEGSDQLPANTQVVGGRLQFTEVTRENSGQYMCVAETKSGELVAQHPLNVGPASLKRKRKHSGRRSGAARHRRRHSSHARRSNALSSEHHKHHTNTFGTWFSS